MLGGQSLVIKILVPPEAIGLFTSAWFIAALSQPMNALAFATDGIHWGTGDFGYLRNAMLAATSTGLLGIYVLETYHTATLRHLWLITVLWITIRTFFGMIRVWPGIGKSPLKIPTKK
jgi:MATE family multidrug resistance protein